MNLSDVRIGLKNIVANPTKDEVQVVEASDDIDFQTKNTIGFKLNILTCKYSRNWVKLPLSEEVSTKVEQVKELLKAQEAVSVHLKNPVIRLYAMPGKNNTVNSGVSIKADSFDIVSGIDDLLN